MGFGDAMVDLGNGENCHSLDLGLDKALTFPFICQFTLFL
jgi:hypothetical protein